MIKKQAREKAWDDMRLKYPPPGVEPVEPPKIETPVLLNLDETPDPEPEEDPVHIPGIEGSIRFC